MSEPIELRESAIGWLKERSSDGLDPLTRDDIADFRHGGESVRLIGPQNAIWRPAKYDAAVSVFTVYTRPGGTPPYEDAVGPDGLMRYAWRGTDPSHPDNRGLRRAMELQLPIIWFVGVAMSPARFQVIAPVYVVGEEFDKHRFVLAPAEVEAVTADQLAGSPLEESMRKYQLRVTRQRMHQPIFRSTVLTAYEKRCAVCNLAHPRLLDAAHIMPDGHERGIASVVNGMSMCKIHHAAFDSHFLGVRPDHVVEIRQDLLDEVDGPMLKHGLQELHGGRLMKVPTARASRPSRELLEMKYEMFLAATAEEVA